MARFGVQSSIAAEKYARLWHAHGGHGGVKPQQSNFGTVWRPGSPTHWQIQSNRTRFLVYFIRIGMLYQVITTIVYLQYRARYTIGVFQRSQQTGWFFLQILFYMYEIFALLVLMLQFPESWNLVSRNAIDMKQIPNNLISPYFQHSSTMAVPPQYSNYPSIDIIIPCYKESLYLVTQVVRGALRIDYPSELLSIYLCDDGKDDSKREMVERLQQHRSNVHYIARPENTYAKPGNVNYTLERTTGHLVVQLDADFVPRPHIIQRLLPYFFVWNPESDLYEFNETLSVVQSPQHYRNLSPHDHDYFDQRNVYFYNSTLVGKDWFNCSSMVGTSNLINRTALRNSGNFPYHSVGDDTALSLIFHSLGYRSYYVNESLATGLCPSTLRGNFAQRARWYKSDFQILLSRHGPFTQPGLTLFQRICYLNLSLFRFLAIANFFLDLSMILVLTAGFPVVDVTNPTDFIIFLALYMFGGIWVRILTCLSRPGHLKSSSANEIFEIIFKYTTAKGLFIVLFSRNRLRWKCGEKIVREISRDDSSSNSDECQSESLVKASSQKKALKFSGTSSSKENKANIDHNTAVVIPIEPVELESGDGCLFQPTAENESASHKKIETANQQQEQIARTLESAKQVNQPIPADNQDDDGEGQRYSMFVLKNLRRCWYNILMVTVFVFSIAWGLSNPPPTSQSAEIVEENGVKGRREYNNLLTTAISLAYSFGCLLCHLFALFLCFKKHYLKNWVLDDLKNGRCDHFAVHSKTNKLYIPQSVSSWLNSIRLMLLLAALVYVLVAAYHNNSQFVPIEN